MLELENLAKSFAGRPALEPLSLQVGPGEIVSLVGTSGCGKSTVLRIVAGLEPASGGRASLHGVPVAGPRPDIAVVFQEPRLMPWLSAAENVRLALLDLPKAEQEARIAEALDLVGLSDFAKALPKQLSGGMAQRAALARALARSPKLLLLDEPFSALDAFTRAKLHAHILSLWERTGLAILLVTHDLDEAIALSDRIVALRGQPGRVAGTYAVDAPRPRRRAAGLQALRDRIAAALDLKAAHAREIAA